MGVLLKNQSAIGSPPGRSILTAQASIRYIQGGKNVQNHSATDRWLRSIRKGNRYRNRIRPTVRRENLWDIRGGALSVHAACRKRDVHRPDGLRRKRLQSGAAARQQDC